MSERDRLGVRYYGLVWTCAACVLLAGGCKRAPAPSSSQSQNASAVATVTASASTQSAEPAPLLLEDEPTTEAPGKPVADNSRCFVCHANYMQEKLAVTHAEKNIGCARCHGASDAHIADESWASGGNGTAPDIMYPRDKINPSCLQCHTKDKIDTPQHQGILTEGVGKQVCTDCHGTHRLPQRRCKWK